MHYDVKLSGESKTYPYIRTTPFSDTAEQLYKMMAGGFLTAVTDDVASSSGSPSTPYLPEGTMAVIIGNHKSGLRKALLAPWTPARH